MGQLLKGSAVLLLQLEDLQQKEKTKREVKRRIGLVINAPTCALSTVGLQLTVIFIDD